MVEDFFWTKSFLVLPAFLSLPCRIINQSQAAAADDINLDFLTMDSSAAAAKKPVVHM
jgi:hypothetical protein